MAALHLTDLRCGTWLLIMAEKGVNRDRKSRWAMINAKKLQLAQPISPTDLDKRSQILPEGDGLTADVGHGCQDGYLCPPT